MQNVTESTIKVTPVFIANKKAIDAGYPIIVNEGGSRSSKSYSVIQLLIMIALQRPMIRISITSHSLPHIKRGAYRDFLMIMKQWGIWKDSEFSFTDFVYKFGNGSYIELFGLEDPSKAHGPGRDILFINEANMVSKALFDQLAMRTTGQIILDLNPSEFNCWVYQVADNPRNKKIHSTYRNNITNISPNQVAIIESYKDLPDDFMWKVYGLGLRGASKETIYTHWKTVAELPGKGDVFYGLDFGFTNPCALVKIEQYEGEMYLQELIYRSGLTITDLAGLMTGLNIGRGAIYCDTAEPKSIEEISRYGFHCYPSDKDVWAGIICMKGQKLNVTADSKNMISEFQSYKWRVDRDDNVTEEPVKLNDHLMDAARYAIFSHLKPRMSYFVV